MIIFCFGLTSLIAVTSAWAVGSVFLKTKLWQLTTTSSLRTTTAPNGPPSLHSTPLYASSIACVKNLWSLSCTTGWTINRKEHFYDQISRVMVFQNHCPLNKGKEIYRVNWIWLLSILNLKWRDKFMVIDHANVFKNLINSLKK